MKRSLFIFAIALSLSGIIWSGLADSSPRASKSKPTAAAPHATAIRNVNLFDGEHLIPNATVVFDKGLITAVGKNVTIPPMAEVIDLNMAAGTKNVCFARRTGIAYIRGVALSVHFSSPRTKRKVGSATFSSKA